MPIQERLKKARKALNLTQEEFGKPVDLNRAGITSLESGRVKISTLHAMAFEYVYNLSSHWLMTGEGDMFINASKSKSRLIDNVVYYESQIEAGHMELIKGFRDKERAKRFNQKLLKLETLSDGLFDKAETTIDQLIETAEIVLTEQKKQKDGHSQKKNKAG